MTIIRRALDLAIAALVVAVVLIALTAYLAPAAHGRALAIRSGSMAPAIGVGSLVVSVAQDPETLRTGDIVTVGLGNGTVLTHRIHAVVRQDDRTMFRLKGDANADADPVLVTEEQVLGKVVIVLPAMGYLLAMMSMPVGVLSLLSTGALLLTAAWLADDLDARGGRRKRPRRVGRRGRPPARELDLGFDGGRRQ